MQALHLALCQYFNSDVKLKNFTILNLIYQIFFFSDVSILKLNKLKYKL